MPTSTMEPKVTTDERPPSRPRGSAGLIAALIVVAIVASGISLYAWQQARIRDRELALETTRTELAQARSDAAADRAAAIADASRLRERIRELRGASAELLQADRRITLLEDQLLAAPATSLGDGRYFGYVSAAGVEHPRILVDLARFLTGQAAEDAAAARGDQVLNAYYVVNDEPDLSSLAVSPDAKVLIVGPDTNAEATLSVDLATWLRAVQTGSNLNDYNNIHDGYWFSIEGGQIVRLDEQWVP